MQPVTHSTWTPQLHTIKKPFAESAPNVRLIWMPTLGKLFIFPSLIFKFTQAFSLIREIIFFVFKFALSQDETTHTISLSTNQMDWAGAGAQKKISINAFCASFHYCRMKEKAEENNAVAFLGRFKTKASSGGSFSVIWNLLRTVNERIERRFNYCLEINSHEKHRITAFYCPYWQKLGLTLGSSPI